MTVITKQYGSRWKPGTSSDTVHYNNCCTSILVTAPKAVRGEA